MIVRGIRLLGALAILAVGAIHLQQYIGADYRVIRTVGTLFLLNAIASAVVGIGLLALIRRGRLLSEPTSIPAQQGRA